MSRSFGKFRRAISTLGMTVILTGCAAVDLTGRTAGFVDARGVHTYYETHGKGPPLMLLHGAAMVAEGWRPQIEALAHHFTVYVPERRGVGRTADVEGEWSYSSMAADTAAFMDALKIRAASVVGWSDGGNIALILASSRPDLVDQLVVSGANLDPEGLGAFKDDVAGLTPDELLVSVPPPVAAWLEIQRRVSPDRGQHLVRSFAKMQRMWLNFDITPSQLARISARTLVMAGDRDVIPVSHTMEIWSSIDGAQLCIAPGATHFWLEEKPRLANRMILDFLLARRDGPGNR
jgi:pimeloyl-ACP methyl ester carboxylesterase